MSDPHSHSDAHPAVGHSAGGDMQLGKIIIVGVASLALFAVGIIWSYELMIARQAEVHAAGMARVPTEIGKPEIGIVDQVPFAIDNRLEIWRGEHAKRLSSYGWIDKTKGIAHIPIEKAMEQVVAQPPDISDEGVVPAAAPPLPPGPAAASPKRGAKP